MHVTISTGQTTGRKTSTKPPATPRTTRKKRLSKKPKGHVANLELIDRYNAAVAAGLPFTYKEFARLFYIRWRIDTGITTEFPSQFHAEAVQNLGNFDQVKTVPVTSAS